MTLIELAHAIEEAKTLAGSLELDLRAAETAFDELKQAQVAALSLAARAVANIKDKFVDSKDAIRALHNDVRSHIGDTPTEAKVTDDLKALFLKGQAQTKK